ncbi:TonB-dependent receptor [Algivirga pacifica]
MRLKNSTQLLLTLLMVFSSFSLWGQERMISGTVKEADSSMGLPGVNILIEGTTNGTVTDLDGQFNLNVPEGGKIVISYIGYVSQTISVDGRTNFDIVLQSDTETLEEIVVVGYGVQKKAVVTGAIASVKTEEITQTPIANASQALQGRTPGVTVTAVSGQPGAGVDIRVRGTGSNGSNAPLYVVDGVQMDNINFLNPNDIESIEVLKDAASAAIYGSRGANGVVLVTTKKGKEGRMIVTYDAYYGTQQAWRKTPVMNAREYMLFHNEGALNAGGAAIYGTEAFENMGVDTDWQGEILGNAPIQNHSVQLSGGNETSQYLASAGYFGQQGIVAPDKSNFERYSARFNSQHKVSDYVTFGSNLTYVREMRKGISEQNQFGGVLQSALVHDPLTAAYVTDSALIASYDAYDVRPANDNGQYFGISDKGLREVVNPLARIHNTFEDNTSNKFLGNAYLKVQPIEGLTIKSDIGVDIGNWFGRSYTPVAYYNVVNFIPTSGVAQWEGTYTTYQWENTINYTKAFGDHQLDLLAGTTLRNSFGRQISGTRNDMQLEGWDYAWLGNGADDDTQKITGNAWQHRLLSFFGKVGYNYDEKYMLSATLRYDGSSNFGPNNKFGVFPSVQAGWNISEEEFLSNSDYVSQLKLRAAWGKVGNEQIGAFGYLELFGQTPTYIVGTSQTPQSGYGITRMANPNLRWEAASEVNLGLDAGFLQDKITLNVDLYSRERQGLLSERPIPGFTGVGNPLANLGTVRNQGVEAALTYAKKEGDFHYALTANVAYNDNQVTKVDNNSGRVVGPGLFLQQGNMVMEEGYPLPYFFGFKTDGIFQNTTEVEAHVDGEGVMIQPDAVPGDIRFVDTNGDGKIDQNDRTYIGKAVHDWTFGANLNMDYRGFDFSMFWQGQTGGSLVNGTLRGDLSTVQNYPTRYLQRWTGEGTTNEFPRFSHNDTNQNYSRINDMVHLEDASYLRLKTVQLGYTLPNTLTSKAGVSKARVYVSANNLLTFTEYSGMDPEVGHGGAMGIGFDNGAYPQARTFLMGLNLSF